jgi:hypothetical protein
MDECVCIVHGVRVHAIYLPPLHPTTNTRTEDTNGVTGTSLGMDVLVVVYDVLLPLCITNIPSLPWTWMVGCGTAWYA